MPANFVTTKWSLLLRINSDDTEVAAEALDLICKSYWMPLYAWLRGNGYSADEAEDLTQGFFLHVIRRDIFQKADGEKGRLRSFLLACLRRYLADVRKKDGANKREVRKHETSLDFVSAKTGEFGIRHDLESGSPNPAEMYEHYWARALLQNAMARLREEHAGKGKEDLYQMLNPLLSSLDPGQSYAAAAAELKTSENAIRIAFHRFKIRFREIVKEEVARTLLPEDDLDEEMRYLAKTLKME